jgi:hypothetical protein
MSLVGSVPMEQESARFLLQFNPICESLKGKRIMQDLLEIDGVKGKRLTWNNIIFDMSSNPKWFGGSSVLYEAELASTRLFQFHSV